LPDEKRKRLKISETKDEIRIGLTNQYDGVNLAKQVKDISQLKTQHNDLISWMSDNKLFDNSTLLNLSLAMYLGRAAHYSLDSIRDRGNEAFERSVAEGIYKVRQSKAAADASFSGFRGDLMTQEDWGRTISAHTQQWSSKLQTEAVKLVFDLTTAPLVLGGLGRIGLNLVGSGALKVAQGAFRGTFIHGSSKLAAAGTILNGAARIAGGVTLIDSGVTYAYNAVTQQNAGHMLSKDGIDSIARVFEGDWGMSVSISTSDSNKQIEGKVIIPIYNQDLLTIQTKSPKLGTELQKIVSPFLKGYEKHDENTSFYVALNTGDRSISYGSTQELDIWKFNIGGFKFSTGYRYKSGHVVPSVNVGYEYENKISKNKTAITFEFRGLKK
jgi:hypothetical protein